MQSQLDVFNILLLSFSVIEDQRLIATKRWLYTSENSTTGFSSPVVVMPSIPFKASLEQFSIHLIINIIVLGKNEEDAENTWTYIINRTSKHLIFLGQFLSQFSHRNLFQ